MAADRYRFRGALIQNSHLVGHTELGQTVFEGSLSYNENGVAVRPLKDGISSEPSVFIFPVSGSWAKDWTEWQPPVQIDNDFPTKIFRFGYTPDPSVLRMSPKIRWSRAEYNKSSGKKDRIPSC